MDPAKATTGTTRLGLTRRAAYGALAVERLWPTVLGIATVVSLFFTLSWFGVFAALPWLGRMAVMAALAAALGMVLLRARSIRLPTADAVDSRIESESLLQHQPLQAQGDRPTNDDPFAAALWREHQKRMAARLTNLSSGSPRTRTERLDPFGLRAVLAMLLVTAFAYSYGSSGGRIDDAFAASDTAVVAAARVDAWVTPPSYTGRAPIFLTDAAVAGSSGAIEAPEGSILSVRVSDGTDTTLSFTPTGGTAEVIAPGGLPEIGTDDAEASADAQDVASSADDQQDASSVAQAPSSASPAGAVSAAGTEQPGGAGEYEVALDASGVATLATTFRTLGAWSFTVTPDNDPVIAFSEQPAQARNGALELAYTVTDDYGARLGRAEIAVREDVAPGARPLVAAPEINLSMPRRTKGEAKGRSSTDITDSPYAGAKIAMTLVATDDAGQVGRSETKNFALPERRFTNPLARAVVEQRRMLALDANAAPRVVELLDAITLRGDEFIPNAADYLALRAVRSRIDGAYDDEVLLSAIDFMWEIALGIEDGNLSLAERRLRDAQENLAEALEKGATDEEIDRLMAELREAMQEYMQAMAEAMQNQPPMSQEDMANAQEIRPSDLEKMMDQIEDLAKSGSKEAAQQLLSELQRMMDNMQAMRQPGQPQQGGEQNAMREQMDKLGEMLRKQQELKDQTYDLGRQQMQRQMGEEGQPPQPGGEQGEQSEGEQGEGGNQSMTAEELQKRLDELSAQQGQLQKELQEFQEAMKGMGMQPGEGFGEAGEAMGEAQSALGQGDDGEAVGRQGQAMEALRKGAQDMMQQMQEAMSQGQGEGQQPGQGQMGQGYGRGEQRSGRDPLGRPRSTQGADFGQDVEVPDEIDTQRARRILDAIRNRLGDALSPQQEREYLERLLQTP